MSVRIDENLCNGCNGAAETLCVRICPGDLLRIGSNKKSYIRNPKDCWDCASCIKACPREAIMMYLPAQIGGNGSTLRAKYDRDKMVWTLSRPHCEDEIFEVETEKII